MLIVNDEQRLRAGIRSLSKRCSYCSQALATYPLILSDDGGLYVYHAACAVELATEILVDLYTFFRPPTRTAGCLCSPPLRRFLAHEEVSMQSTDLEEIKAASPQKEAKAQLSLRQIRSKICRHSIKTLTPLAENVSWRRQQSRSRRRMMNMMNMMSINGEYDVLITTASQAYLWVWRYR